MSKAKPTHMRPILEDVVDAGVISPELRKAIKWALVTIDDLTARLAEAEAHEQQTHERLGAILGTDTSLEEAAKRMAERLAAAEALLTTACDAWECGQMAWNQEGVLLADYKAAFLPRAWYEAAKGGRDVT